MQISLKSGIFRENLSKFYCCQRH